MLELLISPRFPLERHLTDAGLVHLKGLTSLVFLFLIETQITDAGIADLKMALPDCKIIVW